MASARDIWISIRRSPGSMYRWNGRTRSTCSSLHNGALSPTPRFRKNALSNCARQYRQAVGTVHVHPNGRTVYVANRQRHGGIRRPARARRRRELAGGLYHRSGDRRAAPDPAHRHARHPPAHVPHRSQWRCCRRHIMGLSARRRCSARRAGASLAVPHRRRTVGWHFARAYDIDVGATHHVVDGHGGTCGIGQRT